jgi:hypothetical protein
MCRPGNRHGKEKSAETRANENPTFAPPYHQMNASGFASIGVRKELGKIISGYTGLFLNKRTKHLILLGELSAKALVLNARQKVTKDEGPAAAA